MSIGIFAGWNHRPTDAEVAEALGPRLPDWQALVLFVRENYQAEEDWHFLHGDEYGWALCLETQGNRLAALFPAQGSFTVQIDLDTPAVEKAQRMGLGHNAQQAIAQAYPHPEGRSLFIPAETEGDSRDIRHLLALRAESNDDWLTMEIMQVELVADMSHEIHMALSPVIGYSKLLLDGQFGTLTEDQRYGLTSIHQGGWTALRLWTNFMTAIKLSFRQPPYMSFEEVDLRQLVDNLMPITSRYALYFGRQPDSNIEIVFDELSKIRGDVQMLKQAIQWTLEEVIGGQESKTQIKLAEDNGQVRLGITTHQHSIHQPNHTLYFSKRIIALHKGDMQIREWDKPEPGIMVTITLPIR
jgi:signal transduction histidine kinase